MSQWSAWRDRMRVARRRRPLFLRVGLRVLGVVFLTSCALAAAKVWIAADVVFVVFGVFAVILGAAMTVNFHGSADALAVWGSEFQNGPLHIMSGPPDTTRGYRLLGLLFIAVGLTLIGLASTDLVSRSP